MSRSTKRTGQRPGRTEFERVEDHISNGRPAAIAKKLAGSSNTWAHPRSETVRASKRPGYIA